MDWIANPEIWISLLTLTVLEIVLGIDNIVFIAILAGKLPKEQQQKARQLTNSQQSLKYRITWIS